VRLTFRQGHGLPRRKRVVYMEPDL
jgi:hypothetical protein